MYGDSIVKNVKLYLCCAIYESMHFDGHWPVATARALLLIMCFKLKVANVYSCKHLIITKLQRVSRLILVTALAADTSKVDCNKQFCRYSASHLDTRHTCIRSCVQQLVHRFVQ